MPEVSNSLTAVLLPVFWPLIKIILLIAAFALMLGLTIGIFTYGQSPSKKKKGGEAMTDEGFELGIVLSHRFIDWVLGKHRQTTSEYMDDQRILAALKALTPTKFEEFIAEMYQKLGYEVEVTGGSGDGGIDIQMTKNERRSLVQCKKFITQKPTPSAIRDFLGAMTASHIDGTGIFITTGVFTTQAEKFAENQPIELINGTELVELVKQTGMRIEQNNPAKIARIQSTSCPKCGSKLTIRHNKQNGQKFYGCSQYPKCKFTKTM